MGNQIWSLGSMIDFPPLHIDTYQEDVREGEDNNNSIDSSLNISSEDTSFQEALIREKTEKRREMRCELTVLNRGSSDETTPTRRLW